MSLAPMSGFGQVLCAGASCWNQGGGWLAPVAQQSGGSGLLLCIPLLLVPKAPPVPSTLALPAQPPWGHTPAPLLPASNSPLHHYPYWCLLAAILSVQPRQRAAFIPPSSPSPALLLQLFLTCLPRITAAGPRYDPAHSCHPISPDFSWGVFKDPQDFKGGTLSRHPGARDRAGTQPVHPPTDSPSLPFSRLINSRAGKRQGTSQRGSPATEGRDLARTHPSRRASSLGTNLDGAARGFLLLALVLAAGGGDEGPGSVPQLQCPWDSGTRIFSFFSPAQSWGSFSAFL